MAAPALKTESTPVKTVEYTPATPTAKNETKTTKSGIKYETLVDGSGPGAQARPVGPIPVCGPSSRTAR